MQRRDRVYGSAGLGNKNGEFIRANDRIAVTILAGKVDFYGQAGHSLQHEFANQARMPAGPTGGDGDLGEAANVLRRDGEFRKHNVAGSVQAALNHGMHRLRLIVDFFQHEMREAIFGRVLDRSLAHWFNSSLLRFALPAISAPRSRSPSHGGKGPRKSTTRPPRRLSAAQHRSPTPEIPACQFRKACSRSADIP